MKTRTLAALIALLIYLAILSAASAFLDGVTLFLVGSLAIVAAFRAGYVLEDWLE